MIKENRPNENNNSDDDALGVDCHPLTHTHTQAYDSSARDKDETRDSLAKEKREGVDQRKETTCYCTHGGRVD